MCNTTDQNGTGVHVEIEVPDTGAVFTLGQSYLYDDTAKTETTPQTNPALVDDNGKDGKTHSEQKEPAPVRQQSYFFVKNDPIVKIVCGHKQSGVICESGRLFVWGLSAHGQLGLGKTETIHKPSCVRTIKRLKERVHSFSFGGNGFCVILSESGKVYYSGKNIFPFNAKVCSLLESTTLHKNPTDNSEYTPFPVELREFQPIIEDAPNERFTEVVAGFNHFILLATEGSCYGWGYNSHQQLGGVDSLKILTQPERIALDEPVERVFCGNYCTLFVTISNALYLVGKFQKITIPVLKQLTNCILPAKVIAGEITGWDCVYLLLATGQVYRSKRVRKVEDLRFVPFDNLSGLLADDERVTKISSANDCVSFVTTSGRLLTTYDDDCPFTASEHFKELTKFKHFNVTDIASGTEHSLVLAYPAVERLDVTHALELLRNVTPNPTELRMDAQKAQDFIRNEKRRLRREHVEREISKDESITIETSEGGDSDVRFIDNGVNMAHSLTPNGNQHKRHHLKPSDALDGDEEDADRYSAHRDHGSRKTHTPNISQLIDYSDDDNDSISSQSTFHDDDDDDPEREAGEKREGKPASLDYNDRSKNDTNNNRNEDARKLSLGSKLNGSTGSTKSSDRMRKFFKELKSKSMDVSCKNPGIVLDDDVKYSKNDQIIQAEDRASKVCALM